MDNNYPRRRKRKGKTVPSCVRKIDDVTKINSIGSCKQHLIYRLK